MGSTFSEAVGRSRGHGGCACSKGIAHVVFRTSLKVVHAGCLSGLRRGRATAMMSASMATFLGAVRKKLYQGIMRKIQRKHCCYICLSHLKACLGAITLTMMNDVVVTQRT